MINPAEGLKQIVARIEDHFGKPVYISSGYRCPEYNERIPGASSKSYHVHAMAIDFSIADVPLQDIYDYIDKEIVICGLGIYRSHIHVDCRNQIARWDNR